jgi:hypothetical protein
MKEKCSRAKGAWTESMNLELGGPAHLPRALGRAHRKENIATAQEVNCVSRGALEEEEELEEDTSYYMWRRSALSLLPRPDCQVNNDPSISVSHKE